MNISGKKLALFLCIASVLTLYGLLKFFFWEPTGFTKDSLAYTLKVPPHLKNYPIWNNVDTPTYTIRIADGVKPSMAIMTYDSSLTLRQVKSLPILTTYSCQSFNSYSSLCSKSEDNGLSIQVSLTEEKESLQIQVNIIGDYDE